MKETLIKIASSLGLAYWVKIATDSPTCIYYFGPFLTAKEATLARSGYVEDLKNEGARKIKVEIGRYQPKELTIFDDREDPANFRRVPVFN
jgi:hypothetical protein